MARFNLTLYLWLNDLQSRKIDLSVVKAVLFVTAREEIYGAFGSRATAPLDP